MYRIVLAEYKSIYELNEAYRVIELSNIANLSKFSTKKEIREMNETLEKQGYPVYVQAFRRLRIIYSKRAEFENEKLVLNKAVEYYKNKGMEYQSEERQLEKLNRLGK